MVRFAVLHCFCKFSGIMHVLPACHQKVRSGPGRGCYLKPRCNAQIDRSPINAVLLYLMGVLSFGPPGIGVFHPSQAEHQRMPKLPQATKDCHDYVSAKDTCGLGSESG